MNPEEIKVGEKYKLELLCILNKENVIVFETPTGDHIPLRSSDFECVSPANGIKNAEPAPKYDPCRKFRKGDKVRVVEWNGRKYYDLDHNTKLETGCCAEIWDDEENEQQEGYVSVIHQEYIRSVPPCFLELVTPVEELDPYMMKELKDSYIVYLNCTKIMLNATSLVSKFMKVSHPHAKEAAEAECARLNEEWRKEHQK